MNETPAHRERDGEALPELELVLFHAAGRRWAVEARQVAALIPLDQGEGAGDQGEGEGETSRPVPPFAAHLGLESDSPEFPRRGLALRRAGGTLLLGVEEPVRLVSWPGSAIHPLPPLLERSSTLPALRALGWDREGIVLIADPNRL